jgi:hypothetical protein
MPKRDGNQKGAQQHPQGGHGDRTHAKIVEQLNSGRPDADDQAKPVNATGKPAAVNAKGKSHLYEDRQQHDEADKNSDKDRIRHDREKGRTNDPRGKVGEK